jgi:hypothetical protein
VKVASAFTRSRRGAALGLARRGQGDAVEGGADLGGVGAARLGEDHAPVVALEQRQPEPALQRLHVPADRPVGDPQLVRRAREAAVPGGRLEGFQRVQRRQTTMHGSGFLTRVSA